VARQLNAALVRMQVDPRDVVLTSDIGCVGLVDPLFPAVHTVHTIHGRSTAVATGTVLADALAGAGRLRNIVMIGDGGASIGLLHLTQAALLNVDVTVLIHNNMLYGMTGGQHSALTPEGFITSTTPGGNWVPAIDMEQLLRSCGGGFFARVLATDHGLADVIVDAVNHPGFAVVEILEMCTGYAVPMNDMDGKTLRTLAEQRGHALGRLLDRRDRAPYHVAYRERFPRRDSDAGSAHAPAPAAAPHRLTRPIGTVIAGSAGERVQSAAAILCQAVLTAGAWCTQKNDYPVTVGSGFSLSEVRVSPERILYTGIDAPDAIVITSADGLREVKSRGDIGRLAPDGVIIADDTVAADLPADRTVALPLRRALSPRLAAFGGVAVLVDRLGMLDPDALADAARSVARDEAASLADVVSAARELV
jgi:hypothetical protein